MRERRIRIDLAYDGSGFAGWQVQPGKRTVQGTLESALSRLAGDRPVPLRGSGRTDAGVHALGQVADCRMGAEIDDARVLNALRRLLPADVRAWNVATVADGFDARRQATSKTYVYRLDTSRVGDPFLRNRALHVREALDRERLDQALAPLLGTHDWSGFTGSGCEIVDRVRTMSEARFEVHGRHDVRFRFTADGFLTHMVRNLVGTLLEIGRGQRRVDSVPRILEAGDRRDAGPTAPARGLYLECVRYSEAAD